MKTEKFSSLKGTIKVIKGILQTGIKSMRTIYLVKDSYPKCLKHLNLRPRR